MSKVTREDVQKLFSEVKDNFKTLEDCAVPHDFEIPPPFSLPRATCKKCGGWLNTVSARWYVQGLCDARPTSPGDSDE